MLPAPVDAPSRILIAWRVAAALGVAFVVLYFLTAVRRATYPFELEWMEGATLEHVRRVLAGAPLYVRPSLDFIPFTYPPLYYYAAAAVARITGPGFLAPRLVSLAASAGTSVLVYTIVSRESGRPIALTSAGLFAAMYALGGAWLDLGRVDSLYLCLALATGAALIRASSPSAFAAAGVLAALALLTKQTIVVSLVLVIPYLIVRQPRGAAWFIGAAAVIGGGAQLLLQLRSGGWFRYYVYDLPRMRMAVSSRRERLWTFAWNDMARPLAPLLTATAAAAYAAAPVTIEERDRRWRAVLFALGLLLSSALARLEGGAWTNALLPGYAAAAMLFGVFAGRLRRRASFVAAVAAIAQFVLLAYDPRPLVPTSRDAAAGRAILGRIRTLPDGTLVLDHGYLSAMAGKRAYAHGWAMTDVLWADHAGAGRALEAEVRAAIAAKRFPALVLDETPHWFARDFDTYYRRAEDLPDPAAFFPVSGSRRRPAAIYLPR